MNFYDAKIDRVEVRQGLLEKQEKLSLDNPTIEKLKEAYPDIKFHGPACNLSKPLMRVVTEKGGWAEIHEALEVPGLGVLVREFDIYDRHQTVSQQFIYGARLEDAGDGFVRIVRDNTLFLSIIDAIGGAKS